MQFSDYAKFLIFLPCPSARVYKKMAVGLLIIKLYSALRTAKMHRLSLLTMPLPYQVTLPGYWRGF